MKKGRFISVALILVLLVMSLSFKSFAVKVDGALDEKEWKSAAQTVLVSSADTANCNISYGVVYVFCDWSSSRIYIGFKARLTDEIDENFNFGVAFSVDSGEFIYVTTEGVSGYNTDKYDVEAKSCSYSDSIYSVEVALGVKYGMSTVGSLRVRFVDSSGNPSNVYTVDVPNVDRSDVENTTKPVHSNVVDSGDSVQKTTKVRTTKPKTTKPNKTQPYASTTQADIDSNGYGAAVSITADPNGEETTVLSIRELKLYKNINYTVVCVLIVTALGICVAINLSREKEISKKENENKREKDDNLS